MWAWLLVACKDGLLRFARFEEPRIWTERAGDAATLPSRSGTDAQHRRASSAALDETNRRENAAERDGQRPGLPIRLRCT